MCQASENKELPLKAFSDFKGYRFIIPFQQRGYKWTQANVEELLSDLKDFIDSDKEIYCLQPLALVKKEEEKYEVLDGQQRLTTLFLLYKYLMHENPYTFVFESDHSNKHDQNLRGRMCFLDNIERNNETDAENNINQWFIFNAYRTIKNTFAFWKDLKADEDQKIKNKDQQNKTKDYEKEFRKLLNADKSGKQSVQFIIYLVADGKKHEVFRNLNSGKIPLTNTELIKALLLNRVSGLRETRRYEVASEFEQMQQEMQNDHFWYMFNKEDAQNDHSRMDVLFNLVANCKQEDYMIDSRWSFRNYFDNPEKGSLDSKWKQVREKFLELQDLYNDSYTYHYIGFLTYCRGNSLSTIKDLLKKYENLDHDEFVKSLKEEIKEIVTKDHNNITDYSYADNKESLRRLFLLHNIETILQRYKYLSENKSLNLQHTYEQFPFELLHKQHWDIEHIASKTRSDLNDKESQIDWLNSIKIDKPEWFKEDKNIAEAEHKYEETNKTEDFKVLFEKVMTLADSEPDSIKEDDKDEIGNLTLLDRHTNRGYHNALFPRKRLWIIVASGLSDDKNAYEGKITKLYIPPCTRQVFTKAYNKNNDVSLNSWKQKDAELYVMDMEEKLAYYFK